MNIQRSKHSFPILLEFVSGERRFQDDGPDKFPSDIGGGTLTLDPESGGFEVDFDVFAWTHADEENPQLMKGGRMVSLCSDFGGHHLVVQKPGQVPHFPFSGIDVGTYCVAPNGIDLFCSDKEGRLYSWIEGEHPQRIWRNKKGLEVLGFDQSKERLVLARRRGDSLLVGSMDPKSKDWQIITTVPTLPEADPLGHGIVAMNGEKGEWSRFYRTFESPSDEV